MTGHPPTQLTADDWARLTKKEQGRAPSKMYEKAWATHMDGSFRAMVQLKKTSEGACYAEVMVEGVPEPYVVIEGFGLEIDIHSHPQHYDAMLALIHRHYPQP